MNKRKSLNILIRGIILKNKICQMYSFNCRWIIEECFYEEKQISCFFSPLFGNKMESHELMGLIEM